MLLGTSQSLQSKLVTWGASFKASLSKPAPVLPTCTARTQVHRGAADMSASTCDRTGGPTIVNSAGWVLARRSLRLLVGSNGGLSELCFVLFHGGELHKGWE